MTPGVAAMPVFRCHLCGYEFRRHDEGYQHWVVCESSQKGATHELQPRVSR